MNQIVCQLGLRKSLYLKQLSLAKLREYVLADFQELPTTFDLMYVDEHVGDWMILQTQNDLDKVLQLKKDYVTLKILPSINEKLSYNDENSKDVGKLVVTQEIKNMVNFITQKHIERYESKKATQKLLLQSDMMLEQKIPPSRTKFQIMTPQIEQQLRKQRTNQNKIMRMSPLKRLIENKISKSVNCKLNQILPKIVESSLGQLQFSNKKYCNTCLEKQLWISEMIRIGLMQRSKSNRNNPEE